MSSPYQQLPNFQTVLLISRLILTQIYKSYKAKQQNKKEVLQGKSMSTTVKSQCKNFFLTPYQTGKLNMKDRHQHFGSFTGKHNQNYFLSPEESHILDKKSYFMILLNQEAMHTKIDGIFNLLLEPKYLWCI